MILATIYYTADIVTYDGSDTNAYGEPCEPGYGYAVESGWIDPDYDGFTVFEEKSSVRPDTILDDDPRFDDGMDLDTIIEYVITERLGVLDSFDGSSAYAADSYMGNDGDTVTMAAHVTRHDERGDA